MNPPTHNFEDIQDRLLKLEKQNRRFKQLGAVASVFAAVIVIMGQVPTNKIVEGNEFILRDDNGQVRAKLSMDVPLGSVPGYPASPRLVLIDEKGKQRVQLDGGALIPGLTLNDTQGHSRGRFILALETGELFFSDEHGTPKARIGENGVTASDINANRLNVEDESGKTRARLFVTKRDTTTMTLPGMTQPVPVTFNPTAMLALYDEKGQAVGMLEDDSITFSKSHVSLMGGVLSLGDQTSAVVISPYSVDLFDEQGFAATLGRKALVTPRTGETQLRSAASLVMFDKNKNVIWKAP